MYKDNPVESLAQAVYTALAKDLPDIEYRHWTPVMKNEGIPKEEAPIKTRRPYSRDIEVFHFPQTWGSTALGFGGMGGSAISTAYTTVVFNRPSAAVYFDGTFAYMIEKINDKFWDDLTNRNMAPKNQMVKYVKRDESGTG